MYRVGHCHRRGGCSGGAGAGGRYADELCVDISLLWRGYVTDAYLGGGNMSGPGWALVGEGRLDYVRTGGAPLLRGRRLAGLAGLAGLAVICSGSREKLDS